jgi:hypothetical protein
MENYDLNPTNECIQKFFHTVVARRLKGMFPVSGKVQVKGKGEE